MIATEAGVDLEGVEVRGDPVRYLVEYDEETIAPSTAVVAALSTVTDTDPTAVPPLYESVDPDALDALLSSGASGGRTVEASFDVEDHSLTVSGDGVVTIDPSTTGSVDGRTDVRSLE